MLSRKRVTVDRFLSSFPVAAYKGYRGEWWRVWREIQRARGLSGAQAVAELENDAQMRFADWGFFNGEDDWAALVYRRYLEKPEIGPFDHGNVRYLD